jgi:hypothetical protein
MPDLRKKLKDKLKTVINRLSGEYSAVAPETIEPYERPGKPVDDAEVKVLRANLNRPKTRGEG